MQTNLKYKSVLILMLFCLLSFPAPAQETPEDIVRLMAEITEATDDRVAIEKANRLVGIAPDVSRSYILRGMIHLRMNNYEKSVADLSRALALGVDDESLLISVYKLRGLANSRIGDYRAAVGDLSRSIESPDPDYRDFVLRAEAYRKLGQTELAEADEKKANDLRAAEEKRLAAERQAEAALLALLEKAEADFEAGNFSAAAKSFTAILELIGDDENAYAIYFSRGRSYFEIENYDAALDDYNQVIRMRPDLPDSYTFRGEVYIVRNKLDLAIRDFNKAIELDPREILAFRRRGEAFALLGDHQKSIADMDSVLKLDPKFMSAWFFRADAFYEIGEYEKALSDINQYIKLEPENFEGYNLRARVFRKLNKIREAEADEKKALELESAG
jgi:tetratricopeptide (TPR) repeat protein